MYASFMFFLVVGLAIYGTVAATKKRKEGTKYNGFEESKIAESKNDSESELKDEKLISEINLIKETLSNAIEKGGHDSSRIKIAFQKKLNLPEEIACFKRKSGWYYYSSDDRNRGIYRGPYDLNTLIHVLAFRLPIEKDERMELDQKFPSEAFNSGNYLSTKSFLTVEQIEKFESSL